MTLTLENAHNLEQEQQPRLNGREDEPRHFRTVEDLAALPDQLPSGPVHWELWDGEIKQMSPPGFTHGSVEMTLGAVLVNFGQWAGHGRVTGGEAGIVIQLEEPQSCFGADVAFLTNDQLPLKLSPEGYLLTVPALVAEVRSKNDYNPAVTEKVQRYLAAGVRLVWVADPRKHTVTAYRSGEEPVVLGEADHLTAEGIIPDLAFPVKRLFEGLT